MHSTTPTNRATLARAQRVLSAGTFLDVSSRPSAFDASHKRPAHLNIQLSALHLHECVYQASLIQQKPVPNLPSEYACSCHSVFPVSQAKYLGVTLDPFIPSEL